MWICHGKSRNEESFHQQIGLKFTEEASEVLHTEYRFVWCWNWDISENGPEIYWKVLGCGAGEEYRTVALIVWKTKKYYILPVNVSKKVPGCSPI